MKSEWFHLNCLSYSTWSRTCSSHLHATLPFVNFSQTKRTEWTKRTEKSAELDASSGVGGGKFEQVVDISDRMLDGTHLSGEATTPGSTVARDFAVAHSAINRRWRRRGYAGASLVPRSSSTLRGPFCRLRAAVLWSRLHALVAYHSTPRGRYTRIHVSCVTPRDAHMRNERVYVRVCVCAQNRARRGDQAIRKENGRPRFDIYRDNEKKELALRSDLFIEPGIDPTWHFWRSCTYVTWNI